MRPPTRWLGNRAPHSSSYHRPGCPRDEAHRAPRYPERPWRRTCVWNAAGWTPAAEALLSSMSSRRGDRGVPGSGAGRLRQRPELLPYGSQSYGGAIADWAWTAFSTAMRWVVAVAVGQTRAEDEARMSAARRWAAAIEPFTSGVYVNDLADEGEAGARRAYSPHKLARLATLKQHYDRDNRLHPQHNTTSVIIDIPSGAGRRHRIVLGRCRWTRTTRCGWCHGSTGMVRFLLAAMTQPRPRSGGRMGPSSATSIQWDSGGGMPSLAHWSSSTGS